MSKQESRVQIRETSSWTVTRSEIVKFSYKWVIENFTFYPGDSVIVSPPFSANNNDETQWSLKVFPNGDDEESKDWISVFLHLHACKSDYVPAKYKISILNVKQEPIQTTQVNAAVKFEKGRGCGSKRFIKRESILNDIQNCLPCDRLTVLCEMSVLGGTSHISGLNCPVPSESPGSAEPGEPWITRGGGVVPRAIGTVSAPQDDGKQETLERKASDRDDDSREPGDWIKIVRKYTNLAAEGKALAAAITMDLNPRKDPPKSVKGRRSSGSTSVEKKDLPGADCIGICERRLYEQTEVLGALVKDARIAAAEAKKQRFRGTTRSSGASLSKSARAYEPLRNVETGPDRPHSVDEIKVKISNPDLARSLSENLEKTHISSLASSGPTDEASAGNATEAPNSTHPAEPRGSCPVQRREAQRLLVHDHDPFDHLSPSVAEQELRLHDSEQLGVEVFTGDTTDFYAWWADFEEKVHNRSDLSTHQKFAYLKTLLDGDVASAVEITGTEEANFYGTLLNLFHRYSDYDRLDRSARSVSLATAAGAAGEAGSNVNSQAETSRRLSVAKEEKNKGSHAGATESASENQPPDTESPCPPHRVLPRRRSRK